MPSLNTKTQDKTSKQKTKETKKQNCQTNQKSTVRLMQSTEATCEAVQFEKPFFELWA